MEKLICYRLRAKLCSALWRSRKPLGQRENIGRPSALRSAEHAIP